jgi:hypothetical protein
MTYTKQFTGFRTAETFGGATFHVAEGMPNPWNVLPYLAVLAQIAFVTDASVRWRHKGRRLACLCLSEGAVVFFFLCGGLQAALVETRYSSIHPT